jgi:galactose mutarotase-like enzyme
MPIIENECLKVSVHPMGAELTGLFNKHTGIEYLWNADPQYWAKHSPVLFPIVGTLKDNSYLFKGKSYRLSRHGFAREQLFDVEKISAKEVTFLLKDNTATQSVYPFTFVFRIRYELEKDLLNVQYEISNQSDETMYFSIGAHPAFRVPLTTGTTYSDYYLQFEKSENAPRWLITPDGLISSQSTPLLMNTRVLPLSKSLFHKDAIVLKNLHSQKVQIRSDASPHGITMHFAGFPFFGIWAAKNADFVCLEPWCGIADSEDSNQDFTLKEGIQKIRAGEKFTRTWSVQCY